METFTTCRKYFFFGLSVAFLAACIPLSTRANEAPLIWNSPSSNENFVGRESELKKLHGLLKKKHKAGLVGGSGWGKSQAAKEYIRRHYKEYEVIWWIQDNSTQFLKLARALSPSAVVTTDSAVQYVKDHFRRLRKKFLLVFDDVRQHADIECFLPLGGGYVLFTSQNKEICSSTVALSSLSRGESVYLLEKTIGQPGIQNLEELASILSDFPLSLVQSGAYLRSNLNSDVTAYIDLFKTKRGKLMESQSRFVLQNRGASPMLDVEKPFFTTALRLNFEQIRKEDTMAFSLLTVLAFLHHPNMTEEMLVGSSQKTEALSALATLEKYNILEKENESYRTHELIQITMRDSMGEQEQREAALKAVNMAKQTMLVHRNKITDPSISDNLLKNLMVAIQHADYLNIVQKELIEAKIYVVDHCFAKKKPAVAETAIKNIDQYLEKHNDLDPLFLAIYYPHKAASSYYFENDTTARKNVTDNIKKALVLLENDTREEISEDKATALYYLAQMYSLKGELKEAEQYKSDLSAIIQHCAGHMRLYYNALALWITIQNGNMENVDHFIAELVKDENQATSTLSRAYFTYVRADALARKGSFEQSKKYAKEAYDIATKQSGAWVSGRAALVLAMCNLNDKNVKSAKASAEEALSVLDIFFKGPDKVHEQAYTHMVMGDIYEAEENLEQAFEHYKTAERIYEKLLTNLAIEDVAKLYEKMSLTAARMGKEMVTKGCFKKLRDLFGADHPGVMRVLEYLNEHKLPLPLFE